MSGYFPDEGGWSPGDAEPLEGLVIGEPLNPPERVIVPKPKLWLEVLALASLVCASQSMFMVASRRTRSAWVLAAFGAGAIWMGTVVIGMYFVGLHVRVKRQQAELDELHEKLTVRVAMIPRLVTRYGPESAMRLLQMAENLCEEGDFDDIRSAVASIERHHDLDPTVFADDST